MNTFSVVTANWLNADLAEVCGRCISGRIDVGSEAKHVKSSIGFIVEEILMYGEPVPEIYEGDTAKILFRTTAVAARKKAEFDFDDRISIE